MHGDMIRFIAFDFVLRLIGIGMMAVSFVVDVVLFDESFAFQDSRARWLYTGITRAAKRLSIVV